MKKAMNARKVPVHSTRKRRLSNAANVPPMKLPTALELTPRGRSRHMNEPAPKRSARQRNISVVTASAIIFDFDDTLVDWPTTIDAAILGGLEAAGLPNEWLAVRSLWEEIRGYTWARRDGRVVDRAHWKLLLEPQVPWQRAFPFERKAALQAGWTRFRELLEPQLFADALPMLDRLRGAYPLALLSNGSMAKHLAGKLGIADRFVSITLADDPFRKPHARAFEDACSAAAVELAEAIYVGDSFANDVEGAVAAGMRAVWVDRIGDGHPLPWGAWRVDRLSKLPDVIESFA